MNEVESCGNLMPSHKKPAMSQRIFKTIFHIRCATANYSKTEESNRWHTLDILHTIIKEVWHIIMSIVCAGKYVPVHGKAKGEFDKIGRASCRERV